MRVRVHGDDGNWALADREGVAVWGASLSGRGPRIDRFVYGDASLLRSPEQVEASTTKSL